MGYISNSENVKKLVLKEMHDVLYAGHYGYQMTKATTNKDYYRPWMKKEIAHYIVRCLECQKVKFEHRHPAGLLQPLQIPDGNGMYSVCILSRNYLRKVTTWCYYGSGRKIN